MSDEEDDTDELSELPGSDPFRTAEIQEVPVSKCYSQCIFAVGSPSTSVTVCSLLV